MAIHEIQPQKLVDYIAADNTLPDFIAGYIEAFLRVKGLSIDGVTVWPDGRIAIETPATRAEVIAALQSITNDDINPEKVRGTARAAMMAALDAYADAIEAGQTPTAAQTQAAVARLVRVAQYLVNGKAP
jgi:hypothetical protein